MLEVEATGDAINIQQLTGEIEAAHQAALHRRQVHLAEFHAAGSDEFLAKWATATHRQAHRNSNSNNLCSPRRGGSAQLSAGSTRLLQQSQP